MPSPRHFCSACGDLDVAAETEAHGRQQLLAEGVRLARAEPGVERGGEHVGGNGLLDGRLDGPAALAGILDEPEKMSSAGSLASAAAERSSSQEEITLPRRQTSAMSGRFEVEALVFGQVFELLLRRISKPSA